MKERLLEALRFNPELLQRMKLFFDFMLVTWGYNTHSRAVIVRDQDRKEDKNEIFRLLRLSESATAQQIRSAFRHEAKSLHPDLYPSRSREWKQLVNAYQNYFNGNENEAPSSIQLIESPPPPISDDMPLQDYPLLLERLRRNFESKVQFSSGLIAAPFIREIQHYNNPQLLNPLLSFDLSGLTYYSYFQRTPFSSTRIHEDTKLENKESNQNPYPLHSDVEIALNDLVHEPDGQFFEAKEHPPLDGFFNYEPLEILPDNLHFGPVHLEFKADSENEIRLRAAGLVPGEVVPAELNHYFCPISYVVMTLPARPLKEDAQGPDTRVAAINLPALYYWYDLGNRTHPINRQPFNLNSIIVDAKLAEEIKDFVDNQIAQSRVRERLRGAIPVLIVDALVPNLAYLLRRANSTSQIIYSRIFYPINKLYRAAAGRLHGHLCLSIQLVVRSTLGIVVLTKYGSAGLLVALFLIVHPIANFFSRRSLDAMRREYDEIKNVREGKSAARQRHEPPTTVAGAQNQLVWTEDGRTRRHRPCLQLTCSLL